MGRKVKQMMPNLYFAAGAPNLSDYSVY